MEPMSEKRLILQGIVCSGDSIVEALENADIEKLRKEGDNELADLIEKMLIDVERFAEIVGIHDEDLCEEIISEDEDECEEMPK